MVLYAAAIGPDNFGKLEKLLSLTLLLVSIVSFQVPDATISFLSKTNHPIGTPAATILIITSLAFAVAITGLMVMGTINIRIGTSILAYVITTIFWQLFRNSLRGQAKFGSLVMCELVQVMMLLASGFILIKLNREYTGVLVAIAVGNVAAMGVSMRHIARSEISYRLNDYSHDAVKSILNTASKLFPNVLLWWGIELSDRWILSIYVSDAEVGVYSAGSRIAGIGMAAALLMYQAWQVPAIQALNDPTRSDTFFKSILDWYSFGITIVFSCLLVFIEPLSRYFFGGEFGQASKFAAMLIPAFFISSLCYYFGIIYFASNHIGAAWKSASVGLVVSVVANFLLIPIIGPFASPLALFLSFASILCIRFYEAKCKLIVTLNLRNFLIPFAILAAQSCGAFHSAPPAILFAGALALILINYKALWLIIAKYTIKALASR